MNLEHSSLTTTPIQLFNGNTPISQGTGFFIAKNQGDLNILFLVTNYHVLTGHAPIDKQSPKGTRIQFQFHTSTEDPKPVKNVSLDLFTSKGLPIWLTNDKEKEADLAIIPIPSYHYENCAVYGINEEWAKSALKVRISSDVALIGYPYGYYDTTNSLPIWKIGNVASEPMYDFCGKKLLLVDISAFPGMSGSPAFSFSNGTFEDESGNMRVGSSKKFLGIYASMQMLNKQLVLEQIEHKNAYFVRDSESLQLGHIWKSELLFDIINNFDKKEYIKRF